MKKVLTLISLLLSNFSLGQTSNIINFSEAPLQITSYQAQSQVVGRRPQTQRVVRHDASVTNSGSQNVTAFSLGFFAFNSFNEYMGSPLVAYRMDVVEVGASSSRTLGGIQRLPNAISFQGYGTGFAYVRKARLEDGTVWEADLELVLEELQKIQGSLSLAEIIESQY